MTEGADLKRPRVRRASREQLLHMLAEAAEFEHNLLCCYLYAAFSLKREADGELSAAALSAVAGWRKSIMAVAMEEMGHLALVANLTVSIGGRAHFNRPNLPVSPGYHPADIVVELAPFTMETLDHFIFLERPADVAVPDGDGFTPEAQYDRGERAGLALMPSAYDYETIAEFYDTIRAAFSSLHEELGDARLFTGGAELQVGPDVVELEGLAAITDLASAVAAMDTIVVQGEGSFAGSDDSHFARFCRIKAEYEALLKDDPTFTPAYPAARNPVMRKPVEAGDRVHIDDPAAAAVLDLANAVYNHMLRLLTQAYGRTAATLAAKKALVGAAIDSMGVLAAVSAYLATLPASPDAPGVNAGVTFAMLRATEPLVENKSEWALISRRFEELADGMNGVCGTIAHLKPAIERLRRQAKGFAGGGGQT